jgi:hypothetical protein
MVRSTTNEMLPEAARYIAELKEVCASRLVVFACHVVVDLSSDTLSWMFHVPSAARLVTLAAEWELHRKPLLDSIRGLKDSHAKRKVCAVFCVVNPNQRPLIMFLVSRSLQRHVGSYYTDAVRNGGVGGAVA